MNKRLGVLFVFVFCFGLANAAGICEAPAGYDCWYVSPSGSDTASGTFENPFRTVQHAVDSMSGGDYVYMRGGTYNEIDIDISPTKDGTCSNLDCTSGSWSTLKSYPGEWAIIDGSGLNTGAEYRYQHVIRHPTSYNPGSLTGATMYWNFEKFEVTGGRCGFWLTGGPMKFRYLYIHDNGRNVGDDLVSGIFIFTAHDNLIEYNFFENNELPGGETGNNANIIFDGDYKDTSGIGEAFDPNACVKKNTIQYNYVVGSAQGIRLKGDQRFGYNNRNPNPSNTAFWSYSDFGDKIHHNIILGASSRSVLYGQDFSQVYNNIVDSRFEPAGKYDGNPMIYNNVVYNNLVLGSATQTFIRSAISSSYTNYYNNAHAHFWMYNNIFSGYTGTNAPLRIMGDALVDNWDASDSVVDNNLVYDISSSTNIYRMGNTDSGTGCRDEYYTAEEFNSCSDSWRGVSGTLNWKNNNAGLFLGSSGANRYITDGDFVVGGSSRISNGGFGENHPYLNGVSIPSYIGAVNPSDSDWVEGVLSLDSVNVLMNGESGDPSWVEGNPTPSVSCENDNDGDRYGVGEYCLGSDCDDSNPSVHSVLSCSYNGESCGTFNLCQEACVSPPVEICGDGIDQDCNGVDLECSETPDTIRVDSTYSGSSSSYIDDDIVSSSQYWASLDSDSPHWVVFDFASAKLVSNVTLHWVYYDGFSSYLTPQEVHVQAFDGFNYYDLGVVGGSVRENSFLSFDPASTTSLRFYQDSNMGFNLYDSVMLLSEIDYGVVVSGEDPVGGECNTPADLDCDGAVSMNELVFYINRWKVGEVSMSELVLAVGEWSG